MEVTRRIDYACRILRAAYRANGEYLSIASISETENIPYAFARNIQHVLLQVGYVRTRRGAYGGLALDIDPAEVSLYDLMRVLDLDTSLAPCAENPDKCANSKECGFNKVWCAAGEILAVYFSSLNLKDVIEGKVEVPLLTFSSQEEPAQGAAALKACEDDYPDSGEPASALNAPPASEQAQEASLDQASCES